MKLIERMKINSKGCDAGYCRKQLAEVLHGYFGNYGGPNDKRGVYASIGSIQIEGTNEEMEGFAQAILRKVERNREWDNDERIEKVAAQLATTYLTVFGEAIHKGVRPEHYPLLERDFSDLSKAAEVAFAPTDAEAVKKHTRRIIRYRLNEVKGYERIAEAVSGRKASSPATLAT